jgi:radial spoke head protein 3
MSGTQAFMYASEPQAVGTKKRQKYRSEESENDLALSNNIMYDRRVVRGNTYGAQVVTQNASRELERLRMENERAMKREVARRRIDATSRPRTPPPVAGRAHMDTMTDSYLEELSGEQFTPNTQHVMKTIIFIFGCLSIFVCLYRPSCGS